MKYRKVLAVCSFSLIASAQAAAPNYPDIAVSKDDQSGISFTYQVPEPVEKTIEYQGQTLKILEIKECTYSYEAGLPQIPVRIVLIGVPPQGDMNLSYTSREAAQMTGLILPLAKDNSAEQDSNEKSAAIGFYPQQLVEIEGPMFIRSQRVIRLKIYPLQYNFQTHTASLYSEISIQVDFPQAKSTFLPATSEERFDKIFKESLLNYSTAKAWRVENSLSPSGVQADPFSYSDNWYKITVREDGLYRIDPTFLQSAGLDPGLIDPGTLRIFNGGGKTLPVSNVVPRPELKELTISVVGEADGSFDAGDYILFYGWSVDNWEYDSTKARYTFYSNPYTTENVFWLTWGGTFPDTPKRWVQKEGSLGSYDRVANSFRDKTRLEENKTLFRFGGGDIVDYFNWYWLNQSSFNFFSSLANLVSSDTAEVRFSSTSNAPLPSFAAVNGTPPLSITRDGLAAVMKSLSLVTGMNQLQVSYPSNIFLDYYEIFYSRLLNAGGGLLQFDNPAFEGLVRYDISSVTFTSFYLLDISDRFAMAQIGNYQSNGTNLSFQDSSFIIRKKSYILLSSLLVKRPNSILSVAKPNLRDLADPSNRAELLILAHPDFLSSLDQLADLHRTVNNLTVKVVSLEDIYNHFSWGLFDPLAIRDFLKFAYQNWSNPRPAYCLLVGDGSYDYKDNLTLGSLNYVPPFAQQSNVSDDNYIYFGNFGYYDSDSSLGMDRGLDMVIARWPAKTNLDVSSLSQKVTQYQTQPDFGAWKNLITLVADDEYNPDLGKEDEDFHTNYTEEIAQIFTPPSFNQSKIYAIEFPFDVSRKKPAAEEAIVNQINAGTLIVNYSGHGNPDVWAHENIFKRTADIPRLRNTKRLPLISTFSCSIGFFDSPNSEGMAEEFMRAGGGGAIAVVAATRLVFALSNKILNDFFFDRLLKNDSLSIAEALYLTKLTRQPNSNDRHYIVFGEPLLKLAVPQLETRLNRISSDTLKAGSLVTYQGEVYDKSGSLRSDYNGEAEVTVFDATKKRTHIMTNGIPINYRLPGARLFRGKALVQSGQFQGAFIVPKDVSYGATDAKISVYISNSLEDGRGYVDSLPISGSLDSLTDVIGPVIEIGFAGQPQPKDYDMVDPQPTLEVKLADPSGINLTGGLGHSLTVALDNTQVFDVTDRFQYDPGEYQRGSFVYQLPLLEAGTHRVGVKAWDNLNNSNLTELVFQVADLSELVITEVLNYPNPFRNVTNFSYQLSQTADRVDIKIFTLSGRPIKEISNASKSAGYNYATTWDGRDQEGDRVASGVYIYKITAKGKVFKEGKFTNDQKEVFGKLVYQR